MKVFMYYLDGELYAFTTNKGLRDKFEKERSMKVLHKKEKKMDRAVTVYNINSWCFGNISRYYKGIDCFRP